MCTVTTEETTLTLEMGWEGPKESLTFEPEQMKSCLLEMEKPVFVVSLDGRVGMTNEGHPIYGGRTTLLASSRAITPDFLGDASFRQDHGLRYAYSTGAMANGIASEELVIAMGKRGMLGSFGAAGLLPERIESAIATIQAALPNGPYAFNLIHSPNELALERGAVELFLKHGVKTVEASAFMDLTAQIVHYRLAGLSLDEAGHLQIGNRVIAKVSREEVANRFLSPAPEALVAQLLAEGRITQTQAQLASEVPMADDITVEADSGGHTDRRPLMTLLPSIIALRDQAMEKYNYQTPIRVGAGGGIGTPRSAFGAFSMGAAYVVTGSINQGCLESGASQHTKQLLAGARQADVFMAPAADMFEMGVKLQVLKRGTLFPMRASRLYEIYNQYQGIDEIPADERAKLESRIFQRKLDEVWDDVVAYFNRRDPDQIKRAQNEPKRKMALIFRWYLGLSSRWSNVGEKGREMDYQIWCGPSMGAFNEWTQNTYLESWDKRHAADVAEHIMRGASYQWRIQDLRLHGVTLPARLNEYRPESPAI